MKNWLSQLTGLSCLLFVFSACEKDETRATFTPANPPTLTASTNSVVLTQTNEAQDAIVYTWTPVSFIWSNVANEYSPSVTYTLQVDKQGNNFATPTSVDAGSGPTTAIKVKDLNASLNSLGLTPGTSAPVEVRLRASYAPNSSVYSAALPLTATTYKVCVAPNSDSWAIVGPAADGWPGSPNPVTDAPLTYNCDTRTYTITRTLNAGDFKFRKNKDWPGNLGDTGGDKVLEVDGRDINVSAAGVYTISLNLNSTPAPTYTIVKQ